MYTSQLNLTNSYQREIFDYIRDYHPQLFLDMKSLEELIILKAVNAKKAYEDALNRGENDVEARYIANQVLHAFLEFSPCAFIKGFYEELYDDIIDNEQALEIYKKTEDIFEKYSDDVEGTDEEDNLREELRPFMTKFDNE